MGEYDRYGYEDLDEYEEDGIDDGDAEEYEVEEEKPAKEVLEYLELRQKLKEQKRKELKKETGNVNGSLREKNLISRDSYGSFFGPSQPAIAPRVIQESKSLLETASSSTRINKSSQSGSKSSGPSLARNSQSSGQKPKVPNLKHKKVEIIKNTRDYSFLLSDDADVPAPKTAPPRNISGAKFEPRSAAHNRGSVSSNGRTDLSSREDKKSVIAANRMQPKVGTSRSSSGASQVRASMDSRKHIGASNGALADRRKQLSSSNGSGPGRPIVPKNIPSSSSNGSGPGRPVSRNAPPSSSNGSGQGRVMTKTVPPRVPAGTSDRKINVPVPRSSVPTTSKPQSSVPRQPLSRKDEYQIREKPRTKDEYRVREKQRMMPKQSLPAPKSKQVIRPPPKNLPRDTSRDERHRKRPLRHDDDDDPQKALSMIRSMFGYNPGNYHSDEDGSDDMEANFDDIMREESRSARIARQEDEEELRKIEEEERRERLRKEAKRRKLSNR